MADIRPLQFAFEADPNTHHYHLLALAVSVAVATMVAAPGAAAGMTSSSVSTRLAAVCDMIHEHRKSVKPVDDDVVVAIAAMIEDLAATAEGSSRPTTKLLRVCRGACPYEEVGGDDDGELGVGAFGFVVRARHRGTGEAVAVKTLHPEHGFGLWRLLREASFMAACAGHPSHVALRGVERMPGAATECSLVMECVGPSLLDVLRARGSPFPEADVRGVMRQLLAGAAAMHRHGIVHRDIKCENVLVCDGGGRGGGAALTVKICDLGSAKSMAERYQMYHLAGTQEYMAPEVLAKNLDHGAPADAWSLGCVMAELLTGKLLFRGEDEADQLLEIFDVLGAPDVGVWRAMRPRVLLAGEVNVLRERQRKTGHRSRLRAMFPDEVLSRQGFQVLEGLLTCDPKKRMTAAAALRCPWFAAEDDKVEQQCHEITSSLLTPFAQSAEIST